MRDLALFSQNVVASFDNDVNNIREFHDLVLDAGNKIFTKYDEAATQEMIRAQFNRIMGIDFKSANSMTRRQAWRRHHVEIAELIEDVIVDKMTSGWNAANARFAEYVEDINIADGNKNEFFVEDTSLLTVSKFSGSTHDINFRLAV